MNFILYCMDGPDGIEIRRRIRGQHLEYVMSRLDIYRYAGPLFDEDGTPKGSVFILDLSGKAAVEAYMRDDPYFKGGLFKSVTVHPCRRVVPELTEGALEKELAQERQGISH